MIKLPVISGAECVKVLKQIGFAIDRQRGSHMILVREEQLAYAVSQKRALVTHNKH